MYYYLKGDTMTKLCPRGKAAAKRKFKVYPSAYANAYASKICAGKIKDPSGKKRKDWGPKRKTKRKTKKANTGALISKYENFDVMGSSLKGEHGVNQSTVNYYKDLGIG
jgi:hypothetical protein